MQTLFRQNIDSQLHSGINLVHAQSPVSLYPARSITKSATDRDLTNFSNLEGGGGAVCFVYAVIPVYIPCACTCAL